MKVKKWNNNSLLEAGLVQFRQNKLRSIDDELLTHKVNKPTPLHLYKCELQINPLEKNGL